MLNNFKKYITDNQLLEGGGAALLTVSGGRDSVALCDLFHNAGFKFAIAHCNFQLRGKESDGDEQFVKKLAAYYKVKLFVKCFETLAVAEEKKLSIQETARFLRYEWFKEVCSKNGYKYIATGHHKDDELETFFINLVRGTGIAGLHGILPKRGNIIRPLLFASRTDIDTYIKANKLKFREDSSNASDKYLRNNIRHNLLPLLVEMNPAFRETLTGEIHRLREVENMYRYYMDKGAEGVVSGNTISITALKKSPFPSALLYEVLKKYGFNSDVSTEVLEALDSISGKTFFSATHRLVKDRHQLILTKRTIEKEKQVFKVLKKDKTIALPGMDLEFSTVKNTAKFKIPADTTIACLDYDKLKFPLVIRKWENGDFFHPLGMKQKKKLSDFFTDIKLSLPDKENTWIVCSGSNIVYVAGKRIDEHYKVAKNTKLIYLVRCINKT